MKKMMIAMMALVVMSSTVMADPGGNKLIDTSEAVSEALVTFESDNDHTIVELFKGVRGAPKEEGVSVKVYLTDGTSQTYSCHRHDVSVPFECHQSN